MQRTPHRAGIARLRVLIVDEHNVYRTACAALLRTEGVDVAELAPDDDVIGLARAFEPDVVLIDAAAPAARLGRTARQLQSLPATPAVVLISSAGQHLLDPCVADLPFIAKADVSARELLRTMPGHFDESSSELRSE